MGEATLSRTVDTRRDDARGTSRSARAYAVLGYLVILAAYSKVVGLPSDTLQVFAWMWLATVAWNIQAPRRSHLVFVRDWWPALAVLEVYLYSRGLTDEIGLSVHVTPPITVDQWMGGGELPTQRLQEHLCGTPCLRSLPPRWYDGALTGVYYTHFVAAPIVALVLWLRDRTTWLTFMRRYVTLYVAGLFVYITYPMAPPWMASRDGNVTGQTVTRITGRGWAEIGLEHFHQWLSRMGNQVAAMPSLHAATAALIAFYFIARWRSRWRYLLLGYPAAMSLMLVYYGEHYVVDIIAGFVLAGLVMWGCADWERCGPVRRLAFAATTGLLTVPSREPQPTGSGPVSSPAGGPGPTPPRGTDRDRAFLGWLSRLPPLVVLCVLLVLTLVGLMASPYAAVPALVILAGFVGRLSYLSWPDLDVRDRLGRGLVLALVVVFAVAQLAGWL